MLKEIEIQNFRCFEQIKISGFERVNLIGGKNNAGKTALLEAIFLNFAPDVSSIVMLRELRTESSAALDAMPDRAWNNLFYALKKEDKTIVIQGKNDNSNDNIERVEIQIEINLRDSDLIIKTIKGEKKINELVESVTYRSSISNTNFLVYEIPIVPPFIRIPGRKLIESFDHARLDDKDSEVLKAFQIIDPTIESVESFSIGEPTLYLRRKGEKRLPLSLFGDAMNRVAYIILKLVNNKHKILLIDEIENGIHYTNQRNFWRILFRLAVELDTQIFATTHSLEMLQAFADVGLEPNQECSSAYFELAKKPKTAQIIGIRRDLETLNYALEHQKGVRGE
ncbi:MULTISPECIES: AAA family ATPase [unclassified Microcoleus]|uniref:AAA family ATPase n=1 Tax=unclassified Microcoleus TaxID=2642155 RepID=UPI002FD487EB